MAEIGRLVTAMVTPMTADDRVDYETAARLARALVAGGTEAIVVAGSTGEGINLSHEEKLTLVRAVKQAVGPEVPVIANTGNYSTWASIELTRAAADAGADYALLTVPYYNKPPQEGLYQHFARIARESPIPSIIYNVPSRTVTDISAETVVALSLQHPAIVGIKDAAGNLDKATRIIAEARPGFRYWSGDDNATLALMALGAYGVVSIASHLVGRQIREMMEAFAAGRVEEAAAMHRRLLPLINALFIVTNPIPLKYALGAVGFPVGHPRLPLVPLDQKSQKAIDQVLSTLTIDLPDRLAQ